MPCSRAVPVGTTFDKYPVRLRPRSVSVETMSLKDVMLEQLTISRRIVTDGHENVPARRIEPPDSAWLILTRFDPDKTWAV